MRLGTWLKNNNISDPRFAELIGKTPVAVGRYKNGKRIPRPEIMSKIIEITGGAVQPQDFYMPSADQAETPACTPPPGEVGGVRV